jgi:hypothetical protein
MFNFSTSLETQFSGHEGIAWSGSVILMGALRCAANIDHSPSVRSNAERANMCTLSEVDLECIGY